MNTFQQDQINSLRWLKIAVAGLMVAGLLSLVLVLGRLPLFSNLISDPLMARRSLVVHVNLSMLVWMCGIMSALFLSLPATMPGRGYNRALAAGAGIGVAAFVSSLAIPEVTPVLSNYVPVLDHPLFLGGLALFIVAAAGVFLQPRLFSDGNGGSSFLRLPEASRIGLRAAGFIFLIALSTFVASVLTTPRAIPPETYYELIFWGGGHVLQMANVACMISIWLLLITRIIGKPPLGRRWAAACFGLLVLPTLAAPFWALQGTMTSPYYTRFTELMQFGIFPAVSVFLGISLHALIRAPRSVLWDVSSRPYLAGFAASAGLTVLGIALGAVITRSTTLIPAHYHAAIGGITTAYMTVTYLLLHECRLRLPSLRLRRLSGWQPVIFGAGQFVFALGFGYAGLYGLSRKAYGHEQHIRSAAEYLGLALMGVGGLFAVTGGLLFIVIIAIVWRRGGSLATKSAFRDFHRVGDYFEGKGDRHTYK